MYTPIQNHIRTHLAASLWPEYFLVLLMLSPLWDSLAKPSHINLVFLSPYHNYTVSDIGWSFICMTWILSTSFLAVVGAAFSSSVCNVRLVLVMLLLLRWKRVNLFSKLEVIIFHKYSNLQIVHPHCVCVFWDWNIWMILFEDCWWNIRWPYL